MDVQIGRPVKHFDDDDDFPDVSRWWWVAAIGFWLVMLACLALLGWAVVVLVNWVTTK